MVKLVFPNKNGKFELTREEIEELQEQAREEGFEAGKRESHPITLTSPYNITWTTTPNYVNGPTTTSSTSSLSSIPEFTNSVDYAYYTDDVQSYVNGELS